MPAATIPSDIEIAQAAEIEPIEKIAAEIGLQDGDFDCYGRYIAKLSPEKCRSLALTPSSSTIGLSGCR